MLSYVSCAELMDLLLLCLILDEKCSCGFTLKSMCFTIFVTNRHFSGFEDCTFSGLETNDAQTPVCI